MATMERFLRLFRFVDANMERQYRESQVALQKFLTILWCFPFSLIVIYPLLLLATHGSSVRFPYAIFSPPAVLLLGVLAVNLGIPCMKAHIVSVLSVAMVGASLWASWLVTQYVDGVVPHLEIHDMPLVWEAIRDNPAAQQQLDHTLEVLVTENISVQVLYTLYGLCGVLTVTGLSPITLLSLVLVPVAFFGGQAVQHFEALQGVYVPYMSAIPLWTCALNLGASHFQRNRFEAEYMFEKKLAQAVESSRKADSILNHTLKNSMADALADIDLYLQGLNGPEEVGITHLSRSKACLRWGMVNCRNRETYIKLCKGAYNLVLSRVQLGTFVETLIAGRRVRNNAAPLEVRVDEVLCALVLDNALTNALKHGDPSDPDVELSIQESSRDDVALDVLLPEPTDPQRQTLLRFCVSNRANPSHPELTEERISQVLYYGPSE